MNHRKGGRDKPDMGEPQEGGKPDTGEPQDSGGGGGGGQTSLTWENHRKGGG